MSWSSFFLILMLATAIVLISIEIADLRAQLAGCQHCVVACEHDGE